MKPGERAAATADRISMIMADARRAHRRAEQLLLIAQGHRDRTEAARAFTERAAARNARRHGRAAGG